MELAETESKRNTVGSDIPARKMTPEQIQSRRRTTVNNIAERHMFGFTSKAYQNKIKSK